MSNYDMTGWESLTWFIHTKLLWFICPKCRKYRKERIAKGLKP